MTVSYSLDVSKARFCGFTKLLVRWKGSIYKILWKEFLLFCLAFAGISIIYRCALNPHQKDIFEKVVLFVDAFTDLIPLSFVLGFYVSLVIGRWWNQFEAIPWPDRVAFTIASYVHGSDERSRTIRRSLGRYLILFQILTFQTVSTAVKKRFPTTQHLVSAGVMTKEEQSVYEKLPCNYGKFWLPCHWFTALATRARKEGRIKDSILLDGLFREILDFRVKCATMVSYDWVSVPLVYTQVVTIATYLYSIALLVGRQYLDPAKDYGKYQVDLYVPLFTLLQFFFYVGWLKVAEQILNPYGEDDDDFELNWCIDRTVNVVYLIVDHLQLKHPKVKRDSFWDELEIRLPQTKTSANGLKNPPLGSAFNLNVDDPEYLPLNEVLEIDCADNQYKESVRRQGRQNSSFIQRLLSSGFSQSLRRRSKNAPITRTFSNQQGCSNPAFSGAGEIEDVTFSRSSLTSNKKSSLKNLVKKISSSSNRSTLKLNLSKQISNNLSEREQEQIPNGGKTVQAASRTMSAPSAYLITDIPEWDDSKDGDYETNSEEDSMDVMMPSIPEEGSRANSLASIEIMRATQRGENSSQQIDQVHELVKEASEVLHEISKTAVAQEKKQDDAIKVHESCFSLNDQKDLCEVISDDDKQKENSGIKNGEMILVSEGRAKVISVDIPSDE